MANSKRALTSAVSGKRRHSRWILAGLLVLVFGIVLCSLATLAFNFWRNMSDSRSIETVEELIDATLPADAADLKIHRWEPGADLAIFAVYIKFASSEADFTDLMERMNMDFHDTEGAALMFLPAAWGTEADVRLDWWEAREETPAEAAAAAYGVNGWIVAKYEEGAVYIIVTDSGYFEGSGSAD